MNIKYYAAANTSDGFYDFTAENLHGVKRKIGLKGECEAIKSAFLEVLKEFVKSENTEDLILPGTRNRLSGIIYRDTGLSVTDNIQTADSIIDFDKTFGQCEYCPEVKYLYEGVFNAYKDAKRIHDQWEKIYIDNIDFERLNSYSKNVIDDILKNHSAATDDSYVYKRFFGTALCDGNSNYIDSITKNISRRLFIKGRPGTGKSTFLKKLANEAKNRGFQVEAYYCSFDPQSLDMVVIRALSVCVFDSTSPHEMFPVGERDSILDFYKEAGLEGIDEKYKKEIFDVETSYKTKIAEGKEYLRKIKEIKESADRKSINLADEDKFIDIIKKII